MSGQQPPPDPAPDPWRPPTAPGGRPAEPAPPPYGQPSPPVGLPPQYAGLPPSGSQPPPYGGPPPYAPPYGQPYPQPGWSPYPPQQPGWYAPPGQGWAPPPPAPRRAPPRWLYALPAVLMLGAVLALTVFFLTRADELRVASQSEKIGRTDTGVSVLAKPGWHYDIYLPDTEEAPSVGSCTFQTDAPVNGSVVVDDTTSGNDYFTDGQQRDWVQVGTITAPEGVSGRSRLTCAGFTGPMDVYPDNSMFGWMFLVIVLSALTFLAGVAVLVVLLVLRSRARTPATPPPAAPGYGYAGW